MEGFNLYEIRGFNNISNLYLNYFQGTYLTIELSS